MRVCNILIHRIGTRKHHVDRLLQSRRKFTSIVTHTAKNANVAGSFEQSPEVFDCSCPEVLFFRGLRKGWLSMSTNLSQDLLNDAMRLPDEQRAALAAALIESLDESVDEDAEAAWSVEIARRLQQVQSGDCDDDSLVSSPADDRRQ